MKTSRLLSEKETEWQENLKRIWLEKKQVLGLTQETAAAMAGWKTQSAFNQFLNGKVALNTDAIIRISKVLDVPPWEINKDLAFKNEGSLNWLEGIDFVDGPPLRKRVPVISWVAAGAWCDAEDPYPVGMAESWEECPYNHSERSVCLRVVGDSMSPEYREGELILVDPAIEAKHGDDVIARTPDGKATFKRLQVTPDGTFLIAMNPAYPERIIKVPANTHICGVVTASWMQRRKR